MATDTREVNKLIQVAKVLGAEVSVSYDAEAWEEEGRLIPEQITVKGLEGVGPFPMGPIGFAEGLRPFWSKLSEAQAEAINSGAAPVNQLA